MPPSAAPAARILRFDSFELDLHAGELRKRGVKLRLQGQPVQLLGILLQSAGKLVTREELKSQLWPVDTFVDFDHGLHNAIGRIREVLGDSAETPRYIETLPRRGYRFIAPVEEVPATPIGVANGRNGNNGNEKPQGMAAPATATWRKGLVLILAGCGIAIAAFAASRLYSKGAAPRVRSIAVLPLQNLSSDAGQEYFADAMTDELITEMSRIESLRVISHTSVTEYKGTKKHLPQIARELGVDDIVEGSIVRDGNQVRVTVQLLDAPNDRHLWSEDYQRPVHGILGLQKEISEAIAQQIRVKLTPQLKTRFSSSHTVNPAAHEAYLRGRYYLTTQYSTAQGLLIAKGHFDESIQKDPGFALAYAGLAETYIYLGFIRYFSPQETYNAVQEPLRKALELDDSLGEARSVQALLNWQYRRDFPAAEREFNYALASAPGYDCAHAGHANFLAWSGKRDEALAEVTRSRELNPGSSFATSESAVYFLARDYAALVEASRKGIASDPHEWIEHFYLAVGYEALGKRAEAIPEYEKAVEISSGDQDATAALAHAYAKAGRRAEAEKALHNLEHNRRDRYVSPYMIATVHAGLGNKDKAFDFLEKAYEERSLDLVWNLKADPRIDNLRADPRFHSLSRRAGLPE